MWQNGASRAARRDGVGFVKKEHCVLLDRRAKYRDYVFRCLAKPHRLCLGIIDNQKLNAERMRNRSAQSVFPVPGGPAKLNANPRPEACRSPRPHRSKIRL